MSKPVVVIGGGGHARVVIDMLNLLGIEITGVCDNNLEVGAKTLDGIEVICGDDTLLSCISSEDHDLVHGIGSLPGNSLRRELFVSLTRQGFYFQTLVHPAAVVAAAVRFGQGVQVMAGAVVQAGSIIGDNCIVNTRSCVDHDGKIDDHCHVAPGAVLGGNVSLADRVHIGSGAVIIQGIKIGSESVVGAGAIVTSDIPPGHIAYPARSTIELLKCN